MDNNRYAPPLPCVHKPLSIVVSFLILLGSCQTIPVKRELRTTDEIASIHRANKYIKAHMKGGSVYILHDWRFDTSSNTLNGYGSLLGINRNVLETRYLGASSTKAAGGPFKVSLTDIALIETNHLGPSLAAGLIIVTGITVGVTIACIINPKACFGSCPTFYAFDGDTLALQAEGFSTSVAPSLEKKDIDMLFSAKPMKDFELLLTNEALETHSIRHANLLVFEKEDNERVFASPEGTFYKSNNIKEPLQCVNENGSCLKQVVAVDGAELFSPSDPDNLDSKEEIFFNFNIDQDEQVGLVIGKRQTLMTTFLMYQGLAYMGKTASYWLAQLERGNAGRVDGIFQLLGGIEVYSKDSHGNWNLEGTVNETGPIATDFSLIPLSGHPKGDLELKLRLNRGLWRINYLALATLSEKVEPIIVKPTGAEVISGIEMDPLNKLLDEETFLVTYPGDSYRIKYQLPSEHVELFLDSKGYYLEWMREEWVKEQNLVKLNMMVNNCPRYLRKAAPAFKKLEPSMEESFWNSRYVKN